MPGCTNELFGMNFATNPSTMKAPKQSQKSRSVYGLNRFQEFYVYFRDPNTGKLERQKMHSNDIWDAIGKALGSYPTVDDLWLTMIEHVIEERNGIFTCIEKPEKLVGNKNGTGRYDLGKLYNENITSLTRPPVMRFYVTEVYSFDRETGKIYELETLRPTKNKEEALCFAQRVNASDYECDIFVRVCEHFVVLDASNLSKLLYDEYSKDDWSFLKAVWYYDETFYNVITHVETEIYQAYVYAG